VKVFLHWALVVAAVAYLAYQVPALVYSAGQAGSWLGQARWPLVAVAVLLGVGAVVLYGELHRELLLVGQVRMSVATVQAITLAQNAVTNTVPVVGGAGALAYAITRMRRHGADPALASWAVFLAGLLTTLWLLVLATFGLAITGRLPLVWAVAFVAVLLVGGPVGWLAVTHPAVLRRLLHPVVELAAHLPHRCAACRASWAHDVESAVDRGASRVALLRPGPGRWGLLLAVAAATWVFDFSGLAAIAAAVWPAVPWAALIVGFLLVQASIAVQVLPGGAGLAEVGLLAALTGAGIELGASAAIVLLYRVTSWLLPSRVGWGAYVAQIHLAPSLPHRHRMVARAATA
jgi:uncharacterized membrane protein YbhN (UPF0104 family)